MSYTYPEKLIRGNGIALFFKSIHRNPVANIQVHNYINRKTVNKKEKLNLNNLSLNWN